MAVAAISGCLGIKAPPVSHPAAPAVFVDYHRTGGITGVDDRLVIFDNGVSIISRKTASMEITLNQTYLDLITSMFNEAQFSRFGGNYTARQGSADYFRYTIRYHSKTVNADESAFPPSLQPVIDEMNRIISAASREQINRPFATLHY